MTLNGNVQDRRHATIRSQRRPILSQEIGEFFDQLSNEEEEGGERLSSSPIDLLRSENILFPFADSTGLLKMVQIVVLSRVVFGTMT